jgi:hypothetical protein
VSGDLVGHYGFSSTSENVKNGTVVHLRDISHLGHTASVIQFKDTGSDYTKEIGYAGSMNFGLLASIGKGGNYIVNQLNFDRSLVGQLAHDGITTFAVAANGETIFDNVHLASEDAAARRARAGAIAGGVIGGLGGVALVVVGGFFLWKRFGGQPHDDSYLTMESEKYSA